MAKAKGGKRAKDLSAKSKAKKVKGGNLSQDREHVNRDTGRIGKQATDLAGDAVRGTARTPGRVVRNIFR